MLLLLARTAANRNWRVLSSRLLSNYSEINELKQREYSFLLMQKCFLKRWLTVSGLNTNCANVEIFNSMMTAEYQSEIAALEAKYAKKSTGNIVFYGSSSIRLWPRLSHDFPAISIENFGFGGSTLADCAQFFERLIVPRKPRAIAFYAGDNDLFLGASPEEVWNSLRALLDGRDALLGAIPFAFLSIKPSPARLQLLPAIIEANQWCWREIQGRENAIWVDVFAAMLDENRAPRRELYAGDGLHLSRAGYAVWKQVLTREVPWLNR